MRAVVIIGGGPAGCQCALWLHMLGYKPVIVEKAAHLGGLQSVSPYINNWIVGAENTIGQKIAENMHNHIHNMSIPVYLNSTVSTIKKISNGFDVTVGDELIAASKIVIATGVTPRRCDFTESHNVIIGPGKTIASFSFSGKRVAIIGGGDNAAENYIFIKEKNSKLCHVYARSVRARQDLWSRVNLKDAYIGEYFADQGSMTITHGNLSQAYDVFIILCGWEANIPEALNPYKLDLLDDQGFISTDFTKKTKISNMFAAGEVARCLYPCVVTAMADGVIVAKTILSDFEKTQRMG